MKKLILSISLILFLTGCPSLSNNVATKNTDWETHQEKLEALTHWTMFGKMAIITPEKRYSLNINWQQTGDYFHITLSTFIGFTVLDIKKTELGTEVVDYNKRRYFDKDTDKLIKKLSGIDLPTKQLQQWIKGNPGDNTIELNENNYLKKLLAYETDSNGERDDDKPNWQVDYDDYRDVAGTALPFKLQLKRDDLRLKFSIHEWVNETLTQQPASKP